jgi:predicted Zn-ribbon and HTH transcriptional regulator
MKKALTEKSNCTCKRCGYRWYSALSDLGHRPRQCPHCHSAKWDEAKKVKMDYKKNQPATA